MVQDSGRGFHLCLIIDCKCIPACMIDACGTVERTEIGLKTVRRDIARVPVFTCVLEVLPEGEAVGRAVLKIVPDYSPLRYVVIHRLADKARDRNSSVWIRQHRSLRGKTIVPSALVFLIKAEGRQLGRIRWAPRHRA